MYQTKCMIWGTNHFKGTKKNNHVMCKKYADIFHAGLMGSIIDKLLHTI